MKMYLAVDEIRAGEHRARVRDPVHVCDPDGEEKHLHAPAQEGSMVSM